MGIISNVKVNGVVNPIGYNLDEIMLTWIIEEVSGKSLKSSLVIVSENKELTNGKLFESNDIEANLGFKLDMKLKPRTRYFYKIIIRTDIDELIESEINYFESDKMDEDWQAKFVTVKSDKRVPCFSKQFSVEDNLKQARLYISGLGMYSFKLNDKVITGQKFTPYCNDYDTWVQYQTFDITSELQLDNSLDILVGDGWYNDRFGFAGKQYGNEKKLIFEIVLDYGDYETVIASDTTIEAFETEIISSSIYDGEHQDYTIEKKQLEVICATPPKGRLMSRRSIDVLEHEQLLVKEVITTPKGDMVLNLGQNIAGTFQMKINEKASKKVKLTFGEYLENGEFYNENMRSAKAEFSVITDGGEKNIEPNFTFYGYQYVKVEGIENTEQFDFVGKAIYSNIEQIGYLETQNNKVNQLISNTMWSLKDNFIDIPTDCPQRDERLGWTGDAQVFIPTANMLVDARAFYKKYLFDMLQEQKKQDGMVPEFIPAFGDTATSAAWGDAACIMPWELYQTYGDTKILEQQYESMQLWVNYIKKIDTEKGWGNVYHFGDWLGLDNVGDDINQVNGGTDVKFIADVYFYYSVNILYQTSVIIDRDQVEIDENLRLKEKLLKNIKSEYFTLSGKCILSTQTALLLSLEHKLSDNDDWLRGRLRKLLENNMGKLQTGFVGTPLLCKVLSDNEMHDLSVNLLLNEEYPGWLYAINMGATTIWERWNSILPDGTFSKNGMNSLNHYSYGSIVNWMFKYLGGINQAANSVGYKRLVIKPIIDIRVGNINCSYRTPNGLVKTKIKIEAENQVTIKVTVPFNTTADLRLPNFKKMLSTNTEIQDGEICLESGTYYFKYETADLISVNYNINMTIGTLMIDPNVAKKLGEICGQIPTHSIHYNEFSLNQVIDNNFKMPGFPRDCNINEFKESISRALEKCSQEANKKYYRDRVITEIER